MAGVGIVTVSRTSEKDIGVRNLYVKVGEKPEQNLKYGHYLRFDVPAGQHEVRVSNRLFTKRVTVEVKEGETLKFVAGNVAPGCLFTPFMVITGMGAYKVILDIE